jgi:hypothetical protein
MYYAQITEKTPLGDVRHVVSIESEQIAHMLDYAKANKETHTYLSLTQGKPLPNPRKYAVIIYSTFDSFMCRR